MHGIEPDQRMHNGDVPWWLTTLVVVGLLGLMAFLAGCVNGIPPADGWEPPKPKAPCEIPVSVDREVRGCIPRSRW